jgi:hypothetical protein
VYLVTTNRTNGATFDMTSKQIGRVLLAGVVIELTLATALIHLDLGGTLFALNGIGYLLFAAAYAVTAVPSGIGDRWGWLPRIGLAGYAAVTITAYLVIGPYFALGWITKGIELAIIGLVLADLALGHGTPTLTPPRSPRPS